MGAVVYNIEGDQGGTVQVAVEVQEANGTASNLTGYTGTMEVLDDYGPDGVVLATGTVSISANVVTGTVAGSATLDWAAGFYDIRIANGTLVEYIARGTIKLRPTATQP